MNDDQNVSDSVESAEQPLLNAAESRLEAQDEDNSIGFTLIELAVVVTIVGVLSTIAIPAFQRQTCLAKQKEAQALAHKAHDIMVAWTAEKGTAPPAPGPNYFDITLNCDGSVTNNEPTWPNAPGDISAIDSSGKYSYRMRIYSSGGVHNRDNFNAQGCASTALAGDIWNYGGHTVTNEFELTTNTDVCRGTASGSGGSGSCRQGGNGQGTAAILALLTFALRRKRLRRCWGLGPRS